MKIRVRVAIFWSFHDRLDEARIVGCVRDQRSRNIGPMARLADQSPQTCTKIHCKAFIEPTLPEEAGVNHTEGLEDLLQSEIVHRSSCPFFDHELQKAVTFPRVTEVRPRIGYEGYRSLPVPIREAALMAEQVAPGLINDMPNW